MKSNKAAIKFLLLFSLLMLPVAQAKRLHYESWYQDIQCDKLKGQSELRPEKDRWVRIDCELPNYSVEADFGSKWAESIGQSLYYASLTGKRAGVWLIIESPSDIKYAIRLTHTIRKHSLPVTVWLLRNVPEKDPVLDLYYKPAADSSKFDRLMQYADRLRNEENEKR